MQTLPLAFKQTSAIQNAIDEPQFTIPKEQVQTYVPIVDHGLRDKKIVALTFDADMTELMHQELIKGIVKSWYNQKVIDELNKTNTKATLFLTGLWIQTYPQVAKDLASNKLFELENHSFDHPSFFGKCFGLPFVPKSDYANEIEQTTKLLKQVAGVTTNTYFRWPGGCYDNNDLSMLQKLHMTAIQWDVVSGDSYYKNAKDIVSSTLRQVQDGSIIVMHMHGGDLAPATADALPAIISELKKRGFTFVTISQLLGKPQQVVPELKTANLSENYITPTQAVKLASSEPYYYQEFQQKGE